MRARLPAAAALAAATLAAYAGVTELGFLEFDDDRYLTHNPRVQQGLTPANVVWAFTTLEVSNWHPLSWLAHMLDCELFGLDPAAHHLVSAGLHALNAVLLFALLARLCGRTGPALLAAALFALHPLRVESVAWVSERKDLLCAAFGFGSLLAWREWVVGSRRSGYVASLALYAASLMAKPMLVTLPLLLLLLDHWPFGRLRGYARARVREKLPFVALAAASSAITWYAQARGGSLQGNELLPLDARLATALVGYARYLGKAFWPLDLIALYPHPGHWPLAGVLGSAVLLAALAAVALAQARRRPWLLFGLGWFLVALVPVSGIVQVGRASLADRYTYLPLVGPAVALAWEAGELAGRSRGRQAAVTAVALAALVLLFALTRAQVAVWRDGLALWGHALAVDRRNPFALVEYGASLGVRGDLEGAIRHFREALQLDPSFARAHFNLGRALHGRGDLAGAAEEYGRALALAPRSGLANQWLGIARLQSGDFEGARGPLARAAELAPSDWQPRASLGELAERRGDFAEAIARYRAALALAPSEPSPLRRLAWLLAVSPDTDLRRPAEGLELARALCRRTGCVATDDLEVFAAANAAAGRVDDALEALARAATRARELGKPDLAAAYEARAARYQGFKSGSGHP